MDFFNTHACSRQLSLGCDSEVSLYCSLGDVMWWDHQNLNAARTDKSGTKWHFRVWHDVVASRHVARVWRRHQRMVLRLRPEEDSQELTRHGVTRDWKSTNSGSGHAIRSIRIGGHRAPEAQSTSGKSTGSSRRWGSPNVRICHRQIARPQRLPSA